MIRRMGASGPPWRAGRVESVLVLPPISPLESWVLYQEIKSDPHLIQSIESFVQAQMSSDILLYSAVTDMWSNGEEFPSVHQVVERLE